MNMFELLQLEPYEPSLQVEDEPALDIALPQIFTQPELTKLQRGKLPHVELVVAKLHRLYAQHNGAVSLGADYQELVNEYQPLFAWATACWDYLLTTEGCRFLSRHGDEKLYSRGDYRAVTDRDYSRLVHRMFRACVFDFAQQPFEPSLNGYLRARFWDAIVQAYRKLDEPLDPRQRTLTGYSYLRCIPYQFLNDYHHTLVYDAVRRLPRDEAQAIDLYFLKFHHLEAAAESMALPPESVAELLRRGLVTFLRDDRLIYCLLRQIERY